MTANTSPPGPGQIAAARDVLLALARLPEPWPSNDQLLADLVRQAACLARRDRKRQQLEARKRDAELRDSAGIRGEAGPMPPARLARPAACYACKRPFDAVHAFYDSLCPACAELNFARRGRSTDLRGRVALVTGGRVKSGCRLVLKLLRAGAEVIATTRFPKDAARRFAAEPDAEDWSGRLALVGLDLRVAPAAERFADWLAARVPRLDVFVSNAAQTVRRPPAYYRTLVAAEREPLAALPPAARDMLGDTPPPVALAPPDLPGHNWHAELALLQLAPGDDSGDADFPAALAPDGEPADLRPENSWGLSHGEVGTVELFEAHAINCLAPFVLLRALRPLFRTGPPRDRFAVMVSAAEGQFASEKSGKHPHTNMAKAALNMMVRTSAAEFAADRVFLTAVDPGWFSVQQAAPAAERLEAAGVRVPLDAEDAAARILDPVFTGIETGSPASGVLFKDYRVVPW
jgi:NAD(P)-dependent dehydrogenase (short-subunit alcohol dehydrogenase family)